jgi:hypothetical protein
MLGTSAARSAHPSRCRVWIIALVAFLVAATPVLAASSYRCGSRLVGRGSGIEQVYNLCGEPTDRAMSTEFVTVKVSCDVTVTRAVQIEEWTYNRGPKQFLRYLTFRDGTLVGIEEGDYGF